VSSIYYKFVAPSVEWNFKETSVEFLFGLNHFKPEQNQNTTFPENCVLKSENENMAQGLNLVLLTS